MQTSSPTKKKNLFDDDEDDGFMAKKAPVKTQAQPAPPAKPAPSKQMFNDSDDEPTPAAKKAPAKPSANNKKKLFDDSD
jgi:hypothetical protein